MSSNSIYLRCYWNLGNRRFGFEKSTIFVHSFPATAEKYMTRWILYWGWGTLRLHKFFRGDDDRASHTHPWWFITIPLSRYQEEVYDRGRFVRVQSVAPFRPHWRPRGFEHVVLGRTWKFADEEHCYGVPDRRPFYTVVLTGPVTEGWGFYPAKDVFVPWREYK